MSYLLDTNVLSELRRKVPDAGVVEWFAHRPASTLYLSVLTLGELRKGIEGCDLVMMLRLQLERMNGAFVPSMREYFRFYGLDREKLSRAAPHVRVMHPGPMNRGVEIDSEVADDPAISLIQDQVEMGVAARMAVLASLAARLDNN